MWGDFWTSQRDRGGLLHLPIVPMMIFNIRRFREQEAIRFYTDAALPSTPAATSATDRRPDPAPAKETPHSPRRIVLHLSLMGDLHGRSGQLPAIGLFINSFRPVVGGEPHPAWWTPLFPGTSSSFTFSQHDRGARPGKGLGRAFLNSLPDHRPSTVIVIAVAVVRGVRVRVDGLPRQERHLRGGGRAARGAAPGDPGPLLRLFATSASQARSSPSGSAYTGFGLPFAVYLLRNYMGGLPRAVFEAGGDRRGQPGDHVLPARAADERPGARRHGDLPVPMGLERPVGRTGVHRRPALEPSVDGDGR